MHSYDRVPGVRSFLRAPLIIASLAVTVSAAGCVNTPDAILSVQDPDIINPTDVQSPAGANAVRLGALARLNAATSGNEALFLLGGLLSDEWRSGDTFIARDEIDQRNITRENSFLTTANRVMHRARLSAEQAVQLLAEFAVSAPTWQPAEMYFVQAYVENLLAEHYCSGIVFSTVRDGVDIYGTPITTTAAYERALAHADSGLAIVTGTTADANRVRSALQITRGRILLNLNRPADAAAAVAGVATTYRYNMFHSQTTNDNQWWALNNSARRYTMSAGEGTNGINFATAGDPRVPSCLGGSAPCAAVGVTQTRVFDNTTFPFHVQLLWPTRDATISIMSGVEARLIEAEAQLRAGNAAGSLSVLNTLRAAQTGLAPLADAGTEAARVSQLFRERAFWLFGRGFRLGDMRRLVRQYNRPVESVFPTGVF